MKKSFCFHHFFLILFSTLTVSISHGDFAKMILTFTKKQTKISHLVANSDIRKPRKVSVSAPSCWHEGAAVYRYSYLEVRWSQNIPDKIPAVLHGWHPLELECLQYRSSAGAKVSSSCPARSLAELSCQSWRFSLFLGHKNPHWNQRDQNKNHLQWRRRLVSVLARPHQLKWGSK